MFQDGMFQLRMECCILEENVFCIRGFKVLLKKKKIQSSRIACSEVECCILEQNVLNCIFLNGFVSTDRGLKVLV